MAIDLTQMPAEFCQPGCPYMELKIKTDFMYGDAKVKCTATTLYCEHEESCKMWNDIVKSGRNKTCKGCMYDGDPNCENPEPCVKNKDGTYTGYYPIEARKEANWLVNFPKDEARCSYCSHTVRKLFTRCVILPNYCPCCHRKMGVKKEKI